MANAAYFNRVALDKGNVQNLQNLYANATRGLDQELAMQALDGGRVFGDSDRARYDKLVAAKQKAQAHQNQVTTNTQPQVNTVKNSPVDTSQKVDTSQQQTVSQDNDIRTDINGNQNTVVNNQDNSIRQYGGNTKVFRYEGKGNSGVDTPVSAATMGGFYDTDDSPAYQAKFFDMHNTLFQDAQKKFSGKGTEISSKYRNFDGRSYDQGSLDSRIENSKLRSYDRATLAKNDLFGDQDRYRGYLSDYKFGQSPDPIRSIEND